MKRILISLVLTLALIVTAFVGVQALSTFLATAVRADTVTSDAAQQQPADFSQSEVLTSLQSALTAVYEQVSPSVVYIEVTTRATLPTSTTPRGRQQQMPEQTGSGTGFVWDTAGHIVTNNHVVEDASEITITFADGTSATARLVGADPNSDLAVLDVDVASDLLVPVTVADSTTVKVGDLAIAIGNPFGLDNTMTVGFVSALGRSMPVGSASSSGSTYTIPDVIQTDAAINPGNSGGVLLNSLGQVVGVTSAIISSSGTSAGIGFAVPSAIVSKVVPSLIADGSYSSSWLGISGSTLTAELAEAMDLDRDTRGALVGEVVANGPADKAGLKGGAESVTVGAVQVPVGGDVIVAIDGSEIEDFGGLVTYLARYTSPGDQVTVTILRGSKTLDVHLTIGARPTANQSGVAEVEG